jgi:hypothetical protein
LSAPAVFANEALKTRPLVIWVGGVIAAAGALFAWRTGAALYLAVALAAALIAGATAVKGKPRR